MKKSSVVFLSTICLLACITIGLANFTTDTNRPLDIKVEQATSQVSDEAFDKVMQVLMHKRCVNCHPAGDTPRQGEDSHLHNFAVQRGATGEGLQGYTCQTCHQSENNDYSGVPGAPHWALAPESMVWEGKTRVEIATQMMDRKRNGGRSAHEIMEHLTEHELVLWAWEPGIDAEGNPRETPPIPKEEYIAAVKQWIDGGAIIPAK